MKRRRSTAGRVAAIAAALTPLASSVAWAQTLDIDFGEATLTGRIIQLILLLTVLSLAPSILLMVTSFTRIIVVLSLLRSAIGLQQSPPNAVLISLALFLTAYVMAPTFDEAWRDGVQPLINNEITQDQALERTSEPIRRFMEQNVREEDLLLFEDLAVPVDPVDARPEIESSGDEDSTVAPDRPEMRTLVPAYMLSELRRAFQIGFLLFLPFVIIDLVIAAVLTSMGMMMLPPLVVSLPFKLIFFVLVDGWWLVAGSLVRSYVGT